MSCTRQLRTLRVMSRVPDRFPSVLPRHGSSASRRRVQLAVSVALVAMVMAACGAPSPTAPPGAATAPGTSAPGAQVPGGSPATGDPVKEVSPSGDIPDNQAYVPFPAPDGSYTVSVPEGWSRSMEGAATVFTDKLNTVRIEAVPRPQAPTVDSVRVGELPGLAASTPGFAPGEISSVTRSAGPGVLVTYQARSAPDPVTGKSADNAVEHYEFWNNGQQVTLTLSGPVGADNVDPWKMITNSLRWQR